MNNRPLRYRPLLELLEDRQAPVGLTHVAAEAPAVLTVAAATQAMEVQSKALPAFRDVQNGVGAFRSASTHPAGISPPLGVAITSTKAAKPGTPLAEPAQQPSFKPARPMEVHAAATGVGFLSVALSGNAGLKPGTFSPVAPSDAEAGSRWSHSLANSVFWSSFPDPNPQPNQGSIDIKCVVEDDKFLLEGDEQGEGKVGWFSNVDWSDDDKDGWTHNGAPPDAIYAVPDFSDSYVEDGDPDLRKFIVDVQGPGNGVLTGGFRLSYTTSKVAVYRTNTKATEDDTSVTSKVESGTVISVGEMVGVNGSAQIELWLEGRGFGSTEFQDVELKAEYVGTMAMQRTVDIVKVTVFHVPLTRADYGYSDRADDNQVDYRQPGTPWGISDNNNGKISWDDYDGDGIADEMDTGPFGAPNGDDQDEWCKYFANVVEFQFTVNVIVPGELPKLSYDLKRDSWGSEFRRFEGGEWLTQDSDSSWRPDDTWEGDEDKSPSEARHIYAVDGPGIRTNSRNQGDWRASKLNFREYAWISIYGKWHQVSNYIPWHSQLYAKPKPGSANLLTRDNWAWQKLGDGWLRNVSDPTKYD